MKPLTCVNGFLSLLLATVFVTGAAASSGHPLATIVNANAEAERIGDHVRRWGVLNDPAYPYVIHARRVRGTRLQFVVFLHRDPGGRGFDVVGKALEVEIQAQVSRRELRLRLREGHFMSAGAKAYFSEKSVTVDLPPRRCYAGRPPVETFAQAKTKLLWEQNWFLAFECYTQPAEIKLQEAFGKECEELLKPFRQEVTSHRLVVAADEPEPVGKRRVRLRACTIAHFEKKTGKVRTLLRNIDVQLSMEDYIRLDQGSDDPITIHCPGGRRLVLKPE